MPIVPAQTVGLMPGCYFDSHRGHYAVRDVVLFAIGEGMPADPMALYAIGLYDDHYFDDDYPTSALDELVTEAEEWLNVNRPRPWHRWGWSDGDFGLYPDDDDYDDHAFTLYAHDIAQLVHHIGDASGASFDVDGDGNVRVHVAGKDALKL